jgi:hypothetical protein
MRRIRIYSLSVFIIFILIAAKEMLINDLKVINPYTPTNRLISWLGIIPLNLLGIILIFGVLYRLPEGLVSKLKSLDFYFIIPFVLYVGWFFLELFYLSFLVKL